MAGQTDDAIAKASLLHVIAGVQRLVLDGLGRGTVGNETAIAVADELATAKSLAERIDRPRGVPTAPPDRGERGEWTE